MNSANLKLAAVLSMLIDHVGAVLFPQYPEFRIIGRLAFPIYAFLLTEGAVYTSDWRKYIGKLLLLAVISEIPFDYSFSRRLVDSYHQNVFWTLAAGLVVCRLQMCLEKRIVQYHQWKSAENTLLVEMVLLLAGIIAVAGLCHGFKTDYGGPGVLLMWGLYLVKKIDRRNANWLLSAGVILLVCAFPYGNLQNYGILSGILILFYNGKRGWCSKPLQWGFYLFYPVHLTILAILTNWIR